ncbi:MAG: RDD family protein [Niabella sp.]|nr:RDD family protein [Niabella sp.]
MTGFKYSTLTARIFAALIDFVPVGLLYLINISVISPLDAAAAYITGIFVTFIFPLFYYIYLQYRYGQTYGKWVMKLKIVNVNPSQKITLQQILIREGIYLALLGAQSFIRLTGAHMDENTATLIPSSVNFYLSLALDVYFTADVLILIFSTKRRALHDLLSGTVVVFQSK